MKADSISVPSMAGCSLQYGVSSMIRGVPYLSSEGECSHITRPGGRLPM